MHNHEFFITQKNLEVKLDELNTCAQLYSVQKSPSHSCEDQVFLFNIPIQ